MWPSRALHRRTTSISTSWAKRIDRFSKCFSSASWTTPQRRRECSEVFSRFASSGKEPAEFARGEISRIDRDAPFFSDDPRRRETFGIERCDDPLDGRQTGTRQACKFARVAFFEECEQNEYVRSQQRSEGS